MSTVAATGFNAEAFKSFLASRDEPKWLTDRRREAWKLFEKLPMPSRADEEWMRTDIRLFRLDRFGFPAETSEAPATLPDALLKQGVDLAGYSVASDSNLVACQIDQSLTKKGVRFGSLEQLAGDEPELVERHLFRVFDPAYDRFAALHAASTSGGTMFYVPKGVVIDRPLHTLTTISEGGIDTSHLLVVLDEGAEATLLSETAGGGETGFHCGAIELILKPGAKLRYVNLQNWSTGVWHFAHQKAAVGRDAQLQWTIGALGSRLAKVNQHVALVGPNAQTQVNGVMFTEGKQHLTYNTLQHHEAPSCKSDLLYKGGLQDKSRLVWRGMIKVDVGAQKTDGYQRNDNLMLSDESRADSIPGLEIEADDVRCTHGATAGRVDEESIFYLRTRGLTRNEALRTYVAGFFQQVFDRITIESVRNALGEAIGRRIREYN
jgi:Fe-S cluster assembly protein SufD